MDIGKNLKLFRKIYKYTQQDIADRLHVTPQAVSRWERNEVTPSLEVLTELADFYQLDIKEFTREDLTSEQVHENFLKSQEVKRQDNEKTEINNPVLKFLHKEISKPTVGSILTYITLGLTFIAMIIYEVAFKDSAWIKYYHYSVTLCMALAFVFGLVSILFKRSARFSPIIVFTLDFISLLLFARYAYMYFSEIFYSGFTMTLFWQMYYGYLCEIFIMVILLILAGVAMFMKQTKIIKKEVSQDGIKE